MTYHTEQCDLINREQSLLRSFYIFNWPRYCKECKGVGQIEDYYDPSPAGVSLGSGFMVDSEPCEHCTCQGLCPRCGQPGLSNVFEDDDVEDVSGGPCSFCGWDFHMGGVPELPECFCYSEDRDLSFLYSDLSVVF